MKDSVPAVSATASVLANIFVVFNYELNTGR